MRLILDHHRTALIANWENETQDHAPVIKLFTPWAAATWLISELKPGTVPEEDLLFGLCDLGLGCPEPGYVALSELKSLRGPVGLRIERDVHFEPQATLSVYADAARSAEHITEGRTALRLAYRRQLAQAKLTSERVRGALLGDLRADFIKEG